MTDLTCENRSFDTTNMTAQALSLAGPDRGDALYADPLQVTGYRKGRPDFGRLNRNLTAQMQVHQR
ncbi:hypothetical protein JIP62_10700 [Brevundimonas vitis]|uniref:Uncharacterized protein n=1 Tax=Brevundimonas vitisensis TaxID=2800818 RepID=A0ABX7BJR6_9CAUL|nr:hypothetical protein [Brevundimonas vitisensis]QQQ17799.1 hypothetical protein JIP62_10700 [Brevundimonas vitisensis]